MCRRQGVVGAGPRKEGLFQCPTYGRLCYGADPLTLNWVDFLGSAIHSIPEETKLRG